MSKAAAFPARRCFTSITPPPCSGHDTPQCPAHLEEDVGAVWPQDGFIYRASEEGLWRMPREAAQAWEQVAPLEGYLRDAPFSNYTDGTYFYYAAARRPGTDGWNHDVLFRVPLAGGTPEPVELGENIDIRGCWQDKLVCLRTTAPAGTFDVDSPQARNAQRQNSVYEIVTVRPGEAPVTVSAIKPFLRDDSAMNFQFQVAAGAVYYAKEAQPGGSISAGLYRIDLATGQERQFLAPDTPYQYLPTFRYGAPESAAGFLLAQKEEAPGKRANVALDIVTGEEKTAWPTTASGTPVELWAVCGDETLVYLPDEQGPSAHLALVPKASFFTGMQGARPVDDTALKELILLAE